MILLLVTVSSRISFCRVVSASLLCLLDGNFCSRVQPHCHRRLSHRGVWVPWGSIPGIQGDGWCRIMTSLMPLYLRWLNKVREILAYSESEPKKSRPLEWRQIPGFFFFFKKKIHFSGVCGCICANAHTWVQVPAKSWRGQQISWTWSNRLLWAVLHRCWDNSGLLYTISGAIPPVRCQDVDFVWVLFWTLVKVNGF